MLNRSRSIFASMILPLFAVGTLILVFIVYMPSQAANAMYTVNSTADTNDGTCNAADCTLREAILAANSTPDADKIVFSLPPSSTITLNGTQLPPITGTLTIDGSTAVNLTISGDDASRVLVVGPEPPPYPGPSAGPIDAAVGSSAVVTLTNLHITEGNEPNDLGGGIYNGGTLNILNSTFSFLSSKHGGIFNDHTLAITNSTFISNSISTIYGAGAGIYNSSNGAVTIANSAFFSNTVIAPQANGGGAIYNKGMMTITNSSFSGNQGEGFGGGAIFSFPSSKLIVSDSTFTNNSADFHGGAIRAAGTTTLTTSTFNGNFADAGGALTLVSIVEQTTISNSTFYGNSSNAEGGAIFVNMVTDISNSTFTDNSAQSGGAISVSDFAGDLTLKNSTLTANSATVRGSGLFSQGILDFSNTIIANGLITSDCSNVGTIGTNINNLIEDGSCNPDFTGDPMLGPLLDNGGDTLTHALLAGSPAIDNGHPATCAAPPVNNLDQRGESRPMDGDGDGTAICDIGSYELERPDFSLVKDGPAVAAAGEFITYTLTVSNNLPVTVTGIVLTDTVPANAGYISGGTLVGNVVSWTVPELSSGAAFSRSFVVTATQTITNDDYRVSASGGYSTTGSSAVVTIVAEPITGLAASNDSPTILGNPTNLMATITTGSDVNYAWDFGDGSFGSGANVSHTYPGVGQYTAVVTASNTINTMTASTVVTITDVPITGLSAGNDSPTTVGNPTTLMASVTAGTNISYTWAFGDGTFGNGATIMHTYPDVGQYTAVVTATNTSGQAIASTQVTIENDTWSIYMPVVLRPAASSQQPAGQGIISKANTAVFPLAAIIFGPLFLPMFIFRRKGLAQRMK